MRSVTSLALDYPTVAAKRADLAVHVVGLVLASIGGAVMLTLAAERGAASVAAIAVYAVGFVLMLAFSLAYNVSRGPNRRLLQRLDHSGIFLMIAGSYTPFTTLVLSGAWAWGMTSAIWAIAALGIVGRVFTPYLREGVWIAIYVAMSWIVVIAAGPILRSLAPAASVLLVLGGALYCLGVVFHVKQHLRYSRAIWHGHVLAGAGAQWAAILVGTLLPMARG